MQALRQMSLSYLTTSFVHLGLIDGTTYWYKVSAVDEAFNEGLNSTATAGTPTDTIAPTKITGVIITALEDGNRLNITWNPSNAFDFVEYWIYRNTTSTEWIWIANTTVNYYLDVNLTNGITYWYKISAVDEVPNEGLNSTPKAKVPSDTVAPPAITTLDVTVIPTGNTLNITWNQIVAPDLLHYQVYRSTVIPFETIPLLNIANVTTTFLLDTNLTDGVTYYYKVLAVDDDGNYEDALLQKSGIPDDTVPPAQPSYFNITNINGSFLLEWGEATEEDFVKYELWRNGSWILVATIFNRSQNWYLDPSDQLLDTLYYLYEIRVYDEKGYDTLSTPLMTNLASPNGDISPPSDITDLNAQDLGLAGNIRLTWSPPPDHDVIYYKVYRSMVSGFTPNSSNLIGTTTTPNYDDYDPTLNGTGVWYYYVVRAVDEANNTATGGNEAAEDANDLQRPIPVLNFKVLAQSDGSMKLTWTATPPSDFISYNIYRVQGYQLGFEPSLANLLAQITNNETFEFIDPQSNLLDENLYTYKIAMADEVDDSTYKTGWNSTIGDFTPPAAPTGLVVVNEGTGDILNISWNVNAELDVDHYNIYRNNSLIDNTQTNFYQDSGLTEYHRRISMCFIITYTGQTLVVLSRIILL